MISNPITWSTILSTLRTWFATQTGITVIYGEQDAPRPAYPYGVMRLLAGPVQIGAIDEIRTSTELSNPAGEEVVVDVVGQREVTFTFSVLQSPPNTMTPASSALQTLSRAQASLGFPSVQSTLRAAGIAIVRSGNLVVLDAAIADTWIQRCAMDVTFRVAYNASEKVGFIETVQITSSEPIAFDEIFPT